MYQTRLNDVPFFRSLNKKELELVARQADEVDVPAGRMLAQQGQFGDQFFVIEQGTAEVVSAAIEQRRAQPA